jgi:hypothetical protein
MALQNITPQYQAEERTAQFHLRPVPIPNGLAQTGRMLTDAGQGLQKASFGLMLGLKQRNDKIQAEEDDLALSEALTGLTTDVTRHMNEALKLTGEQADGITKKGLEYIDQVIAQHSVGLNPKTSRLYAQRANALRLSAETRLGNHEYGNVREARIRGYDNDISGLMAAYADTGDPNLVNQALNVYVQKYVALYGKEPDISYLNWGLREDGTQKDFGWRGVNKNAKGQDVTEMSRSVTVDGKDVSYPLIVPGTTDEELQIIMRGETNDEIEKKAFDWYAKRTGEGKSAFFNGDIDDESERVLTEEQRALESNSKIFRQGVQNIVDSAASVLMDKMAQSGDVEVVAGLYEQFSNYGGLRVGDGFMPVSKEALKPMEQVVEQMAKGFAFNQRLNATFTRIKASGSPMGEGGKYYTPEQESAFLSEVQRLIATGDKDDAKLAEALTARYSALKKLQAATLGTDYANATEGLFTVNDADVIGMDLEALSSKIEKLPYDSALRQQLQADYDKYSAVYREMKAGELAASNKQLASGIKSLTTYLGQDASQRQATERAMRSSFSRNSAVSVLKLAAQMSVGSEVALAEWAHGSVVNLGPGMSFDLRKRADQAAFLARCAYNPVTQTGFLLEDEIAAFRDIFAGKGGNRAAAGTAIAKVLNSARDKNDRPWDFERVNTMAPDLVDQVLARVYKSDGTKISDEEERVFIDRLLLQQGTRVEYTLGIDRLNPDTTYTLKEFLNRGIDVNGTLNPDFTQARFNQLEPAGASAPTWENYMGATTGSSTDFVDIMANRLSDIIESEKQWKGEAAE